MEKTQSSLEDDIKIAMVEADTLVSPTGEVMALWKNTKPTMNFNAKAFQQDNPAGYAKYMEPTASTIGDKFKKSQYALSYCLAKNF